MSIETIRTPVSVEATPTISIDFSPKSKKYQYVVDEVVVEWDNFYYAEVGVPLTFTATVIMPPNLSVTGYNWKWGDGTEGSGASSTHTYTQPLDFSVGLTVTDNHGRRWTARKSMYLKEGRNVISGFRIAENEELKQPISKPDKFLIAQTWQSGRMETARSLGTKNLIYRNATRAETPFAPGIFNSGLTLEEVEALGAKSSEKDEDEGGYVVKIGMAGYKEKWLEKVVAKAREVGADGVFLDDVNDSSGQTTNAETWNAEMQAFNEYVGSGLKAAGLIAIPNLGGGIGQHDIATSGWIEKQFAFYDGGFDESFATYPNGAIEADAYTTRALEILQRQTGLGKWYLGHTAGTTYTTYGLALMLIYSEGNASFYTEHEGYGSQDYPVDLEHALALGHPITAATISPRTFQHGVVSVNRAEHTGVITYTG